ncbi:actin depolymerizing protein [Piromyces finnis]|uniref:Actin depolymerizing protein n=1 Tax=Piromyces finnis TaxID=1754191 RepID=A0A1Y1VP83_9FUNG|nr:actin depolymerizing protein [Piromyces finnis]|eukprot:ORX61228.1 actin depolymerizing protein [Piromyces finnis]
MSLNKLDISELDLTKYLENLNIGDNKDFKESWDGVDEIGLKIWRIEKLKVVPWPKELYGRFYSGDSYIVLNVYLDKNQRKFYDIHFWLGTYTSQDEAGTAAYKTVELDDFLGGVPVQHREIQGCESELFISYFKKFIIMDGGIDSGFNIVKPTEYKPQLFHVKSIGRTLTVTSVPISCSSLNNGDVFVLDQGLTIYQWNGCKASGIEKHKAMELTASIKSERHGHPVITVYDQDDRDAGPFWKAIGGKGVIAKESSNERLFEAPASNEKILFRLSNSSGAMIFKEEARGDLKLSMLDPDDVFIVDVGAEIYIWVGNKSNVIEKTRAFQYAMDYVKDNNKSSNIPITRVVEGNENGRFMSFFEK